MLIKSVDVSHNNQRIASSNEQRFISPYLHAMPYHYMDTATKQYLCPQKAHPGYYMPQERNQWNVTSKALKDYAAHIFNESANWLCQPIQSTSKVGRFPEPTVLVQKDEMSVTARSIKIKWYDCFGGAFNKITTFMSVYQRSIP